MILVKMAQWLWIRLIVWMHEDSYMEAVDKFEASFYDGSGCPAQPCDDCTDWEFMAREDLRDRLAVIRCHRVHLDTIATEIRLRYRKWRKGS